MAIAIKGYKLEEDERIITLNADIANKENPDYYFVITKRASNYKLIIYDRKNKTIANEYELGGKIPPDTGISLVSEKVDVHDFK